MARKLRAGGYGWGHAKQELFEALDAQLAPLRERYVALRADEAALDGVLAEGAERARDRPAHDGARPERRRHPLARAGSHRLARLTRVGCLRVRGRAFGRRGHHVELEALDQ